MTGNERFALERPSNYSLFLNFVPLAIIASGVALAIELSRTAFGAGLCFAAWIYIFPPCASRLLIALSGRPQGRFTQDSAAYRVWWALTQFQILFNRAPWLEELLRLVPGLYALWIRLWGGQLSFFAYVAPQVLITDRHAVRVERGAVLGMRSVLCGHLVQRDDNGRWLVLAAAPVVESEAILGGDCRMAPGAILRAGQVLPVGRFIKPFGEWPKRNDDAGTP
jgi:hypothetical protein